MVVLPSLICWEKMGLWCNVWNSSSMMCLGSLRRPIVVMLSNWVLRISGLDGLAEEVAGRARKYNRAWCVGLLTRNGCTAAEWMNLWSHRKVFLHLWPVVVTEESIQRMRGRCWYYDRDAYLERDVESPILSQLVSLRRRCVVRRGATVSSWICITSCLYTLGARFDDYGFSCSCHWRCLIERWKLHCFAGVQ